MCDISESESGALLSINPCGWYKKLALENAELRQRLAAGDAIVRQDNAELLSENARIRDEATKTLRQRNRLRSVVEAADALEEAIEYSAELRDVSDFVRERMEELRLSVQVPWKMHVDDFNRAVRELANRTQSFDELFECTEYLNRASMIEDAAKAYKEARNG